MTIKGQGNMETGQETDMSFTKKQLENYADVLLFALDNSRTKKNKLKPYDVIAIRYYLAALPLVEVLYRKCLKRKFQVSLKPIITPEMERDFYNLADIKQLKFITAGEKEFSSSLNGYFAIRAPENLTHLKGIDAKKIAVRSLAVKPLYDIKHKREDKGLFSWNICIYPTPAMIKASGLSKKEYVTQIVKACYLNDKNPIKKWREMFTHSAQIRNWLNLLKIDTLHIQSANIDLKVKIGKKRIFKSANGNNIPSFEIFTSPDWTGTEGIYYSNLPDYNNGNYIKGIKLMFKKGCVIKSTANKGGDFVRKFLKTDNGANKIGEVSLTDKRFSRIDKFMADTLFDENHGGKHGNCHIALGTSFSDTYDGNPNKLTKSLKKKLHFNTSAVHWDIVNTEDKIVKARLKNGKTITIYEKGMFKK
jgi:aminopeptidase